MSTTPVTPTASEPATASLPATTQYYCPQCGHVLTFFAALVTAKRAPICPLDSRPLKPLSEASADPSLK